MAALDFLHYSTYTGIEVKSGTQASANDFKGLRQLRDIVGEQFYRGVVVHPGKESIAFDPQLASAPHGALWVTRVRRVSSYLSPHSCGQPLNIVATRMRLDDTVTFRVESDRPDWRPVACIA